MIAALVMVLPVLLVVGCWLYCESDNMPADVIWFDERDI